MANNLRILVILCIIGNVTLIRAQITSIEAEDVSGSDPLLYNGKRYTFFVPPTTGGHQFLYSPHFLTGSVTIRGVEYKGLFLNYDLFNQQLVLNYQNEIGGKQQIVVSQAWLDTFYLNDNQFILITGSDSIKRIYQVTGTGRYKVLYKWHKDLSMDGFIGAKYHTFSSPRKTMFLFNGGVIGSFINNKTFCSLFGDRTQRVLKEFLNSERINIRKADEMEILRILDYLDSLNTE